LTFNDYLTDTEFRPICLYLTKGELTGDDAVDRQTLLMADQYYIKDESIYKLGLPSNRREARVHSLSERLCIPKAYRLALLMHWHDRVGHFASHRLFLTLSPIVYWTELYQDLKNYAQTCPTCNCSKRNFAFKATPLNPLPVVTQPAQCWHIDHKPLTRKTTQGNVAILVFVCAFSNWPILRTVKDMSAKTTADTFFKEVIASHGVPAAIMTDRGSAFSSAFFTHLADLLHIKHIMSASQAARSNGLAESVVKRVSELAKIYVDDDTDIESSLPWMEMALRATAHTQLLISPFQLMRGREMNVGQPLASGLAPSFTGDHLQYFEQLTKRLTELHKQVCDNRRDAKELYKRDYDKRNKVAEAPWTGD